MLARHPATEVVLTVPLTKEDKDQLLEDMVAVLPLLMHRIRA
jgi:hypothetical protein